VRLVPLNRAVDGAEIGKDIPSGRADGMPLLRAGSKLTPRFKEALIRAGVHAVYIKDEATEGIEPKSLLTAETRAMATQAVAEAFKGANDSFKTGRPLPAAAVDQLDKIAARMAREVAATSEFALALADLSGSDSYTLQHSVDVAALGLLIGQKLFLDRGYVDYRGRRVYDKVDNRLTRLGLGLLLHDIGKLAIPTEILNKPGQLDEHEWQIMKTHPVAGTDLLRSELISPLVKVVVRSHHERWDGRGYPDGKSGTDIHELARIASVADVYDAVTSERVYAAAKSAHVGVRIIREGAGTAFDDEVVDVFRKIVAPFPPGNEIELSDGRAGVVADVPEHDLDRPIVRVIGDGSPYDLPLVEHPRIKIVGWEDYAPAENLPAAGGWAI
jgi:HD-GYP domain-containing protein (c-di-GMP phosphodiesterase class II)